MNVRDTSIDGLVVIGIEGDLDRSNVALLEEGLSPHLAAGQQRIVLDLQGCSFIDSAGLGVILVLYREVRAEGALAFAGPNPNIRRVLDIAGLLGREGVEVYADVATACASIPREA